MSEPEMLYDLTGETDGYSPPPTRQIFAALPAPIESALRESIKRFGVLVPVVMDQNGVVIDGHHRKRLADELGVSYEVDTVVVESEAHALELSYTLNADRRQLTADQRRQVAGALYATGAHSYRAIAGALGVDPMTVYHDVKASGVEDSTPEMPERVTGRDGKTYPAKQTKIRAKTPKQAERVLEVLGQMDEPPDGTLDAKELFRAHRVEDLHKRRAAIEAAAEGATSPLIVQGDFRSADVAARLEAVGIVPGSVDLILTDPPYAVDAAPVWQGLADFAGTWLQDGGLLLAYSGQMTFPDAYEALSSRLQFVWLAGVGHTRGQQEIWKYHVWNHWKPVLVFCKGEPLLERWWPDFLNLGTPKKDEHRWAQPEEQARTWIERLTMLDAIVIDPMAGSGAFVSAARGLGRRAIGIEQDPKAAAVAAAKLERAS